jgi:hypothetical protein
MHVARGARRPFRRPGGAGLMKCCGPGRSVPSRSEPNPEGGSCRCGDGGGQPGRGRARRAVPRAGGGRASGARRLRRGGLQRSGSSASPGGGGGGGAAVSAARDRARARGRSGVARCRRCGAAGRLGQGLRSRREGPGGPVGGATLLRGESCALRGRGFRGLEGWVISGVKEVPPSPIPQAADLDKTWGQRRGSHSCPRLRPGTLSPA